MKNPNGAGSVYKLSGKRRKPWAARYTVGYTANGKQMQRHIGTYATRREALDALAIARQNPTIPKTTTLEHIYHEWSAKKYTTLSTSTITSYRRSWEILKPIHRINVATVKLGQLQTTFEAAGKPKRTMEITRNLLAQLIDYAIKYEYAPSDRRDIVRYVDLSALPSATTVTRSIFTTDELQRLKQAIHTVPVARHAILLVYTGLRIGEYLSLTDADIKPDRIIVRKSKTQAGIREIPLLPSLASFIRPVQAEYSNFRQRTWTTGMQTLGMTHTIHDTRHTFATLCTEGGMDPRILKTIIGHKTKDVTEGVYTHIRFSTLRDALNDAVHPIL